MKKIVKIYPEEYWLEGDCRKERGCIVTVDGSEFLSNLDTTIDKCKMKKYFGTIQEVEIMHDDAIPGRYGYFQIVSDREWEWDLCAIQEEYTQEDYPEYFL